MHVYLREEPVRLRMVEVDALVDATIAALAKGRHEITFPRGIAPAYVIQALAPAFMRRAVRRNTIDAR